MTGHRVSSLSWRGVERRLAEGASAILPIGAAAKEHGLHLPMNSDEIQADWLADQAARQHNLLVWPTVRYGYYPAFVDFPGSISLSRETFAALLGDILAGIAAWKPPALFVLNTGISTLAPVDEVIAGLDPQSNVHHLRIYSGTNYRTTHRQICQQNHGSHADEAETSRMLAIAPEVVNMQLAENSPAGPITGALNRQNAPSGSYGEPQLASGQKGGLLIDAMLKDIHLAIAAALRV